MKPFVCSLLLALALAARSAPAQRTAADTTRLEPVTVTATRDSVLQVAPTAATTVITGATLRAQGIVTVAQALGVISSATTVQAGSFGATTSLFLRGGQSNYTLVLVDGAPVNDPGGFAELANLTTDNVERIEIVSGPGSVLYGSDAISGVIQIFTRRASKGTFGNASASGGSYGIRAYDLAFGAGTETSGITLDVARYRTNGTLPFNNNASTDVVSGLVRFGEPGSAHLDVAAHQYQGTYHFPTDFTGAVTDSNQWTSGRLRVGSIDAGAYLGSKVEFRVLAAGTENKTVSQDLPDSPGDSLNFYYVDPSTLKQWSIDARFAFHLSKSTALTAGGAYDDQSVKSSDSSWTGANVGTSSFEHSRDNKGYYANATGDIADHVSYNAGIRVTNSDQFGSFTSYRVGAGLVLTPKTSIRGSVGSGFREPSFYEQYATGFAQGNPFLLPEKGDAWELGLSQSFSKGAGTLGLSYFSQRFSNMIQYDPSAPPGSPNYVNIATATAVGIETDLHATLSPAWSLDFAYTWLRTNVVDAGSSSGPIATLETGQPLLRRPANAGNVGFTYGVAKKGAFGVQAVFVGSRADVDYTLNSRVTLPSYTLFNASALWMLKTDTDGRYLALTFRGNNLLDHSYQETQGYEAPGRTLIVGVKLGVEQ